ncbi:MAG TPA: DUF4188 domain-containing protein [Exiguobacterium sp.]|nr:DUF4188 domain-containing protein [Exiguobacterium sp.]
MKRIIATPNKDVVVFIIGLRINRLRSVTLIQYWRSTEELMAYAHGSRHLTAWKRFNQKARTSEAVGIFHETFEVSNYESMYVNLPTRGLAKTLGESAIKPHQEKAKGRLAERQSQETI